MKRLIFDFVSLLSVWQSMQAQAKMAQAMGSTAKVMAATNKQMKLEDIQKTMANFDKESTKMDLAGEMSKLFFVHNNMFHNNYRRVWIA